MDPYPFVRPIRQLPNPISTKSTTSLRPVTGLVFARPSCLDLEAILNTSTALGTTYRSRSNGHEVDLKVFKSRLFILRTVILSGPGVCCTALLRTVIETIVELRRVPR